MPLQSSYRIIDRRANVVFAKMNVGYDTRMSLQNAFDRLAQLLQRAILFGQRPATLWDIRIAMVASQSIAVALGVLVLWLAL